MTHPTFVLPLVALFSFTITSVKAANMTGNEKNSPFLHYTQSNEDRRENRDWGVAITYRVGSIPFENTEESRVASINPLLFYQGDYFFINGLEAGIHAWKNKEWQVNGIVRNRFIDIPADLQNQLGGDAGDMGIQIRHDLNQQVYLQTDFLFDKKFNFHGVATLGKSITTEKIDFNANISARYKTSDFNSRYYGFDDISQQGIRIGSGVDLSAGMQAKLHVVSNLYLLGGISATYLDKSVRQASTIEKNWQGEVYAGFGFFNESKTNSGARLESEPYLRVAHGFATPSNIGEILTGSAENDPYGNQLTSLFYGYPLSDTLFGQPVSLYLTPGLIWHWSSEVQSSAFEFVTAIKAYYIFDWPIKWRIGLAEGLSYINHITYIERTELIEKGYNPSRLLNYLDISFDINLGETFNIKGWEDTWLGYSLHHRSAIFEKSSQFGRIKGGSNYNTLYLQFKF